MNEINVSPVEDQSILHRPGTNGGEFIRSIVESEEIAWCLAHVHPGATVRHQPDPLLRLIYQVSGICRVKLDRDGKYSEISTGHFIVLPENEGCELTSLEPKDVVTQVIFFGVEQLPGAFFNTYRSTNG